MQSVEAVKTKNQLEQIDSLLSERDEIYLDVWKFGLNTALRISDILSLKMDDFRGLDSDRPQLKLKEQKTGKIRPILLNEGALAVVRRRLDLHAKDVFAFQSTSPKLKRNQLQAINRRSVARVLQSVGQQVNPKVQLGCHSMRKSRGKFLFSSGYSVERICKILNHSSPSITMAYIGLDQQDVDESYTDLVL